VHDYHLIPLAAELRAMGCRQRIGFFLHIPLPPQIIMAAIPQHEWLTRSLFAYDLIGLQAKQDQNHFERYVLSEANGEAIWISVALIRVSGKRVSISRKARTRCGRPLE
jgi:trehalose 6-phosphate synthase